MEQRKKMPSNQIVTSEPLDGCTVSVEDGIVILDFGSGGKHSTVLLDYKIFRQIVNRVEDLVSEIFALAAHEDYIFYEGEFPSAEKQAKFNE